MNATNVDIVALMKQELKRVDAILVEHDMTVRFNAREDKYLVWADPVQLVRVIHNLIQNAIKYSDIRTEIEIEIKRDGDNIRTRIKDQGPGIEQKDRHRVFEPYVRVKSNKKGSGLGLAISRKLIEIMDGQIGILESIPGKSTTFYFDIPVEETKQVSRQEPQSDGIEFLIKG